MVSDVILGSNVTSPGGKYLVYKAWLAQHEVIPLNGNYIFWIVLIASAILIWIYIKKNKGR